MRLLDVTVLVVAKAPVPGQAKTRLIPALGAEGAADLAAAALLDTLECAAEAARRLGAGPPAVALTGRLHEARRAKELRAALAPCWVFPQRGNGFGARLAAAHLDAARPGPPGARGAVVQIGMDTPQADPGVLVAAARSLGAADAVLGPAEDGGWWLLGLSDPDDARVLTGVPMSTDRTGALTRAALVAAGAAVTSAPGLRDVDTIDDARAVAETAPHTRFAAALRAVGVLV